MNISNIKINNESVAIQSILNLLEKTKWMNDVIIAVSPINVTFSNIRGEQNYRKCDITIAPIPGSIYLTTHSQRIAYFVGTTETILNDVGYEYGCIYMKIDTKQSKMISIVYGPLSANETDFIDYNDNYTYIPIYAFVSGLEIYNIGNSSRFNKINTQITNLNTQINNIKNSYIIVDINGNGDYTSLHEASINAGDTANNPKTIIVLPGKYEMPNGSFGTNTSNRYLSIIGTDKNNCILYNTSGHYDSKADCACIRIAGSVYISNLTIISTAENYVPFENSRKMSYCVHFDMNAPENTVCEINNCILKNDHFCCIGIGTRPNYTIKIINCELESIIDSENIGSWGAIYAHEGSNISGTQKLVLRNNVIKSDKYSIVLSTAFHGTIITECINNVCDKRIIKSGDIQITNLSFGNNISELNYDE